MIQHTVCMLFFICTAIILRTIHSPSLPPASLAHNKAILVIYHLASSCRTDLYGSRWCPKLILLKKEKGSREAM